MNCEYCGSPLPESGSSCPHCGAPIDAKEVVNEQPKPEFTQRNTQQFEPRNQSQNEPPQQPDYIQRGGNNYEPPKKKKGCFGKVLGCAFILIAIVVIGIIALVTLIPDDEEYSSSENSNTSTSSGQYGTTLDISGLRDPYTTIKGNGEDVYTIMVYLIGSDLETDGGFATNDIYEMMEADFGENVNLVLMTGGSTQWQNEFVNSDVCEYWQIKEGEIYYFENDLGHISMADPDTLATFISDMASMYPADRYGLICWNHGGGTLGGYGSDEHFPDYMMNLNDIATALNKGGVKFDFVGFDACLMGTAETAFMLEPYADYLIASEEVEPGTGWYYTDWLTALGKDTSMSTVDLGTKIIDDYIESISFGFFSSEGTLSLVELREMPYTYSVLSDYFADATIALQANAYKPIATARSNAKSYGEGEYEQVDAVDFVQRANLDGSQDVVDAIGSAVKYYRNTSSVSDSYGLAIYFPYDYPSYYADMQNILFDVGYTNDYTDFFSTFISAMSGGQNYHRSTSVTAPTETTYETEDWYNEEIAQSYADSYEDQGFDQLIINEKGDEFVLSLTDEQWEEITKIELQALLDDGEGYVDLGSDNIFEFDDDGDLIVAFDYTWVSLDGQTVPFYAEKEVEDEDGNWFTYGIVPAYLNETDYIEVVVYWDDQNPEGYVAGYRKYTETGTPSGKGMFQLVEGDTLEWAFDYYDYDLCYEDSYIMGDMYTVSDQDITVSYKNVGNQDALVYFQLTDIYNNVYTTECIVYTDAE